MLTSTSDAVLVAKPLATLVEFQLEIVECTLSVVLALEGQSQCVRLTFDGAG